MTETGEFSIGNPRKIEYKNEEARISVMIEIDREDMDKLSPEALELAALTTAGFAHTIVGIAQNKEKLAMMGLTPEDCYAAMAQALSEVNSAFGQAAFLGGAKSN